MKKLLFVLIVGANLFGSEFSCELYIDKLREHMQLFIFAAERRDTALVDLHSERQIYYEEKVIATCVDVRDSEFLEARRASRLVLIKFRKDVGFN